MRAVESKEQKEIHQWPFRCVSIRNFALAESVSAENQPIRPELNVHTFILVCKKK